MLIELGATFLNKVLWEFLNKLFPTNSVSTVGEVTWEVSISKIGINVKYNKKQIELNNKQITSLLNDNKLSKDFSALRQKIIDASNGLDSRTYKVRSKGGQHSIEVNKENSISGSIKFKENLTYEEIYKKTFLRGETISIEKISFDTIKPEMNSEIHSLKQKLSESSSVSLRANTAPNIVECSAIFESASAKYKYYDFSMGLSLYDYTEGSVTFKNHLDDDTSINLALIIPLDMKKDEHVKFNYSLSKQGARKTSALIDFNTLNRLLAHEDLKLTIKELETGILLFSGILPKVEKYLESDKKELEHEINTLKIIQKAEREFDIKFQVSHELEESDVETLSILEMLFNENTKLGKSSGIITAALKPYGIGVLHRIEGNLTFTNEVEINLFGTKLTGISRVISFSNIREVGNSINNRRRLSDGSLEIKFNQFGDRKVEERFILTQKVDDYFKNIKK